MSSAHSSTTAVRTSIQISYDKGLFDNYASANQIYKDFLLVEVNDRGRSDLDEVNDDIH